MYRRDPKCLHPFGPAVRGGKRACLRVAGKRLVRRPRPTFPRRSTSSRMRFLRNDFRTRPRPQRSGPRPRTEPTPACGHPSGGGDFEDEDDDDWVVGLPALA